MNCELYDEEREDLRKKVGAQSMRSSQLLGDEQIIKKTVDYIEKTGRSKLDQR